MPRWLFKQEPGCYSYADLERDGGTLWDGVANPLALRHLRQVRRGDRILFYHTGKEKAVVGEMVAAADAGPDPKQNKGKAVVLEVQAVRRLPYPVPLARIKEEPVLADWDLVRLPRLSVLPVSAVQWRRVVELSQELSG